MRKFCKDRHLTLNALVLQYYFYYYYCYHHHQQQRFYDFYSAAALHAMQSAVIPTAIPSLRPSVRPSHAGTLSKRMNIGLRGLHCEVAKTLVF